MRRLEAHSSSVRSLGQPVARGRGKRFGIPPCTKSPDEYKGKHTTALATTYRDFYTGTLIAILSRFGAARDRPAAALTNWFEAPERPDYFPAFEPMATADWAGLSGLRRDGGVSMLGLTPRFSGLAPLGSNTRNSRGRDRRSPQFDSKNCD